MLNRFFTLQICVLFFLISGASLAQTDSLEHARTIKKLGDVITLYQDSLQQSQQSIANQQEMISQLTLELETLRKQQNDLQSKEQSLTENNAELQMRVNEMAEIVKSKSELLEKHIQMLKEKELIFNEKEMIYKNAILNSKIDSVQLSEKIRTKNAELDGKVREISLLELNIEEKKGDIDKKNSEIDAARQKSERFEKDVAELKDTLTDMMLELSSTAKDLDYANQKLESARMSISEIKRQLYNCQNRGKKKKVRVVQGIAVVSYRTPHFELAPESSSNPNNYVINNKNAGNLEVDYVTGTTLKLLNLTEESAKLTSDLGLFIGLGGKELFKNFYIGPNIKLFNMIHINTGANLREYEILKDGFIVGDQLDAGSSIPTNNKWRLNYYFGLTFDFDLISGLMKK